MKIAISGASGLIGTALTKHLAGRGHTVVAMKRRPRDSAAASPANTATIAWDPHLGRLDPADLIGLDAIVNLAGPGIASRRWTPSYRAELRDARVAATSLIADTMAQLCTEDRDGAPRVLVSASAIGYYGDRGEEELNETSGRGEGFLPDLCAEWEDATTTAADAGVRVAIARTGIVLSAAGGALPKMLPMFRVGMGGRFGNGRQWMSWISMTDEVRAIEFLLTANQSGPFNLTAPHPVRNSDFVNALGRELHRPTKVPVPGFGPRMLLGRELANALLFDSARVLPVALQQAGFEFQHPELGDALASELGSGAA